MLWQESRWREIVSTIVISPLMKKEMIIEDGISSIISYILFKLRSSLKLEDWEIVGLPVTSVLLMKMNKWKEMCSIIILYLLNKLLLKIQRTTKIYYNLNMDERKTIYKDYEVLCEKCNNYVDENYRCIACVEKETDEKEKNRILFGMCKECSQPNTGGKIWCSHCNPKHFQQNFDKWTSGNKDIDELIKKKQLTAMNSYGILEWIPYDKFADDVEHIAEGGFANVYSATWVGAYIRGWDHEAKDWKRKERKKVALKILKDYKHISKEFLNEVEALKKLTEFKSILNGKFCIVPFYGFSQDPVTENYILVFKYIDNNFQYYYQTQEFNSTILHLKLVNIYVISLSLDIIHQNDLIHRDLHLGNILQERLNTYISDYGLCKPANESDDKKIYGIIPFVAPEILRKKPYTKESDIYSLGIVINAIVSSNVPFNGRQHDRFLALDIRRGLRPEIRNEVPQELKELIQRCWDEDPEKRPTMSEINDSIESIIFSLDINNRKTLIDSVSTLELLTFPNSKSQATYERYKSRLLDLPDDLDSDSEGSDLKGAYSEQVPSTDDDSD